MSHPSNVRRASDFVLLVTVETPRVKLSDW
jgi:hypothetical protein